jgi:glycosyltransferase involved in cell wall biosynthesis
VNAPRVTFVVTCHNYGRFLGQSVESLLGQSLRAIEVIVVDDGSSDDTALVLRKWRDEPRVRVIRHPRALGHIQSLNEGLTLARGEFVGLLAADDYCIATDGVEQQVSVFDADPGVGFVYSAHWVVDASGRPFRINTPFDSDRVRDGLLEFADLAFVNYVPHSGTLARRTCHEAFGHYDLSLPYSGDLEMWLRLSSRFRVGYIATPLYAYRVHASNMSHAVFSPRGATDDLLRTLRKSFDALPASAPESLRRLRETALDHALLKETWNDRSLGRTRRAWTGLADATRRKPALLRRSSFWGAFARLSLLTALGHARYVRLAGWRGAPAGGAPLSTRPR